MYQTIKKLKSFIFVDSTDQYFIIYCSLVIGFLPLHHIVGVSRLPPSFDPLLLQLKDGWHLLTCPLGPIVLFLLSHVKNSKYTSHYGFSLCGLADNGETVLELIDVSAVTWTPVNFRCQRTKLLKCIVSTTTALEKMPTVLILLFVQTSHTCTLLKALLEKHWGHTCGRIRPAVSTRSNLLLRSESLILIFEIKIKRKLNDRKRPQIQKFVLWNLQTVFTSYSLCCRFCFIYDCEQWEYINRRYRWKEIFTKEI